MLGKKGLNPGKPLGTHHDRASFSCGETSLDRYIRRQASQDIRRRVAQVLVASSGLPERVAGYHTLSAARFERDDLPPNLARRLPRYPAPAPLSTVRPVRINPRKERPQKLQGKRNQRRNVPDSPKSDADSI